MLCWFRQWPTVSSMCGFQFVTCIRFRFRRASGISWKVSRAVRSSLRSAAKRLCIWSSSGIETATFATLFHSPLLREKFCMPLFRSLVVPMNCCEAWRACRLCHFLLLQSVWYSDFILSVACYKAFGNKERGRIHCCQISIVVLFVNSSTLLWHMTGLCRLSFPGPDAVTRASYVLHCEISTDRRCLSWRLMPPSINWTMTTTLTLATLQQPWACAVIDRSVSSSLLCLLLPGTNYTFMRLSAEFTSCTLLKLGTFLRCWCCRYWF